MKKWSWLFVIVAVAVCLICLAYPKRAWLDIRSQLPWNDVHFSTLYKIVSGSSGDIFVIRGSKELVTKLDSKGTLMYQLDGENQADDIVDSYNQLAVDGSGNLYVLRTQLEKFGLYVANEQIIRYKPTGEPDRIVYEAKYTNQDNLLRVGQIRAMRVVGDKLRIVKASGQRIELVELSTDGTTSALQSFVLPAGEALADVTSGADGTVYYSTKKGSIYKQAGSEAELLFPGSDAVSNRRTVPDGLSVDKQNRLYMIDHDRNVVLRIGTDPKAKPETVISGAEWGELKSLYVRDDGTLLLVTQNRIIRMEAGKPVVTIEKATFSPEMVTNRLLVWAEAVAAAALLLYAVRYLFVRIMERRLPLMVKQMVVFVPTIIGGMIVVAVIIVTSFSGKLELSLRKDLSIQAHHVSKQLVNGDALERLTLASQYMNEDYRAIKDKLNHQFDGVEDSREGLYNTVYKLDNGKLYMLMDDDDSVNMFTPYASSDDTDRLIKDKVIVSGHNTDETGDWMFAMAPVYNSKGVLVGIYETGKDMHSLQAYKMSLIVNIAHSIIIMSAVIALIVGVISYLQLSSIRKLRDSATAIASGKLETTVDIRSRDEVEDLGESFNQMAGSIRSHIMDMQKMNAASNRFVPLPFLRKLGKDNILDVKLGEQVENSMCVLTMNMRDFYEMSKGMSPMQNFNFINSFLKRFGPIVPAHNGIINKYLGPGILALFPERSEDALKAAIEMRRNLEVYNSHRSSSGYPQVDIGIGVHRGDLMLGIIGETERLEGSVISDDVNISAILDKTCAAIGAPILITQSIVDDIEDVSQFQFRNLGRVHVEGKDEPIQLYDVFQGDTEAIRELKARTKERFEQAVEWYQNGQFLNARQAFLDVIKQNRWDKAARHYFYLSDDYYQRGSSDDWNGALKVS